MPHQEAIAALRVQWQRGGRAEVEAEWLHGLTRQNDADFFWKTLFDGAMVDGGAEYQPQRAEAHHLYPILRNFQQVQALMHQNQYLDKLERFLAPAPRGIGHRWGNRDNPDPRGRRIYSFLAAAPAIITQSYGSVGAAGQGLLQQPDYTLAKAYLDPVLPPSWKKSRANFLMMLSVAGCQNDLAVDLRMKNIATAWAHFLSINLNVGNHPSVVAFFRTQVLPDLAQLRDGVRTLWQLDRLMFKAYQTNATFRLALGLPIPRQRRPRTARSFGQGCS